MVGLDARRQVVELYRPALDRLGAVTNAALDDRKPGRVRIGGLVVTRQHPMTAKGTVFLALEDETGMVNVTLWPDTWARLRGVVRRHALLLVDGDLQRESSVVNVIAREVRPLIEVAATAGAPEQPQGVKPLGYGRDAPTRRRSVAAPTRSAAPGEHRAAAAFFFGDLAVRALAGRTARGWPPVRVRRRRKRRYQRGRGGEERARRDADEQRLGQRICLRRR